MKKVVVYIATSLDGYIADKTGGIKWLEEQENKSIEETSYIDFIKDVDTVILGFNTFNQIVTELSPNVWPYFNMNSYVLTDKDEAVKEMIEKNVGNIQKYKDKIVFTNRSIEKLISELKNLNNNKKNIWICGGANVINQLVKLNLIDKYHISIIPTILGSGIRLFDDDNIKINLKLNEIRTYNGIVELEYVKR